jgi:SAM-dependent methyltransferase
LSAEYLQHGAATVIGVDIDGMAIDRARRLHADPRLVFRQSGRDWLPLPDGSIDVLLSYDAFEHVADPPAMFREIRRVLRPSGRLVIGTWGWGHPFAPHLWAVMPVPWAHLLVSERTLLRVCRRVYQAPWYRPTMHDYDEAGRRRADKYTGEAISRDYLNHYLVRDFERALAQAGLWVRTDARPFGAAPWSRPLLRVPWLREVLTGFVWFVSQAPS